MNFNPDLFDQKAINKESKRYFLGGDRCKAYELRLACIQQEWGISQLDNYLGDIEARFETLASDSEHPTVKDRSEIRKGCFSSSINELIIIFRKIRYSVRILRVLYKKMDFVRQF